MKGSGENLWLLQSISFFRRPSPEKTGCLHFATLAYKLPLTFVFLYLSAAGADLCDEMMRKTSVHHE
jgi:hypothetical protein